MGHGCTRSVEKSQIVYVVSVEEKQQFLREIPYGGAILSLVSVHLSHTNDSPTKAEPLILCVGGILECELGEIKMYIRAYNRKDCLDKIGIIIG